MKNLPEIVKVAIQNFAAQRYEYCISYGVAEAITNELQLNLISGLYFFVHRDHRYIIDTDGRIYGSYEKS